MKYIELYLSWRSKWYPPITGHYNDMNLLGKYLIDKREI